MRLLVVDDDRGLRDVLRRALSLSGYEIVLAATGVRRSELLALRWEDVDLDGRILTIGGSVVRLKGQGLVRQDTTEGGAQRSVPLPQFAVDALHRRKGEAPRPNTAFLA